MTPDDRRRDRGQRARQNPVAAQRLDVGRADENPQKAGREGHPGREQPAERAGQQRRHAPGARNAAMKPTNCSTMMSGPGVVSAMPSPSSISPGRQPVQRLDHLLRDIGEHRVGAAEGHDRHLREEHGDLREDVVGPRRAARWRRPAPATGTARSPRRAALRRGRAWHARESSSPRRATGVSTPSSPWPCPPAAKSGRPARPPTEADQRRARTISGKGTAKKKMPTKAARRAARRSGPCSSAPACRRAPAPGTRWRCTAAFRPKNRPPTSRHCRAAA